MNSVHSLAEAPPSPSPSSAAPVPSPTPAPAPIAPASGPGPATVSSPVPGSASMSAAASNSPPVSASNAGRTSLPPSPTSVSSPIPSAVQSLAALATQQHQQNQREQERQQQRRQLSPTPTNATHIFRPEHSPVQQPLRSPLPSIAAQAVSPPPNVFHPIIPTPQRKDTSSSISTQATSATQASAETNNTSYSADTSPNLHQSVFSHKDGPDISNRRPSHRRRTGPLSQQSRERAALIRKLGACIDCRRRRVACHPSHHNMTWEDVINRFHRSSSPSIPDLAPTFSARPMSPGSTQAQPQAPPAFSADPQEMDIDSGPPPQPQISNRTPLTEGRHRTPLPSGPRLEKSLSLPGIETLKNDLQSNASRMLSMTSRSRYNAVQALLLYWQDDDEVAIVHTAVRELADVFDKFYHYTFQIQPIPSNTDGSKSSWRWLSRQLNDFAEDRDQRDVLKIVYYVGHTYLDSNREMVLASSRDVHRASTIRWNGIQQSLEEVRADTLILMDAAYYPSTKMFRQQGVLELIAATTSEEHYTAINRCAFTQALAELLRARATRQSPLSAAEVHSNLFALYPQMVLHRKSDRQKTMSFPAPFHILMSGNSRLPSIFLTPVVPNNPLRNSQYDNHPLLQLSIRLSDDHVDLDTWSEWLRLMPDGVKDVRVEGPFRQNFK